MGYLKKHSGEQYASKNMVGGILKGQWFTNINCKLVMNECIFKSKYVCIIK